ncbi:FecR domain-containing protein [Aeoliella sp.]|uniref:FecR domain-containing protein n=1 Tax=Aeoliella sp. TaxID=2795800 RepID=UPI003CCC278C
MADDRPLTLAEARTVKSLVHDLCDDNATDAQKEQLREYLQCSEQARQIYVRMMYVAVGMHGWSHQSNEASKHTLDQPVESCESLALQLAKDEVARMIVRNTPVNTAAPKGFARWRRSATLAAAIAACLLVAVGVWKTRQDRGNLMAGAHDPALTDNNNGETLPPITPVATEYVAQVVDATGDVRWVGDSAPFDFGLRVGTGERIALESSVLRLQYFSGATIILHGPASFTPTGPTSGHLAAGKLTGRVSSAQGESFRLATPSADVIDLGTEFGVAVSETSATDVCVFEGEVEVKSSAASRRSTSPIRLTQGMTLRMSADGLPDMTSEVCQQQFLRSLPERPASSFAPNEVSLVDAVIGGVGLSHRLFGALDPNSGKVDEQPLRSIRMADEMGFRFAVYNEFVDGVFIPHRRGKTTRIDSYGNAIEFPPNLSVTESAIWARRPVPNWSHEAAERTGTEEEQWGLGATRNVCERLAESRLGVVGMHANVGISFDAHTIQSVEGRAVRAFRCKLANVDSSCGTLTNGRGGRGSIVDVHVFVDGIERCTVPRLSWYDGDQEIEIELGTHSRIVTIAITDSDLQLDHDEILMIDPVLELSE